MGDDYPLTGRPFAFATLATDHEAEAEAAAGRGLALPPGLAYAFGELCRRARQDAEAAWPGELAAQRADVEDKIATLRAALDRLVRVRVNPPEAARMTGYDRSQIQRLIQSGKLYAERVGREYRIPIAALDALPPRQVTRPRKEARRDD